MRKQSTTVLPQYELLQPQGNTIGVKLREHFRYLSEDLVEYDEYTINLPNSANVEESLQSNIRAWIAYARTMETRPNSSAIVQLEEKHDEELAGLIHSVVLENMELQATVAALEDALCEQDAANEERLAAIEDALCELDKEGE